MLFVVFRQPVAAAHSGGGREAPTVMLTLPMGEGIHILVPAIRYGANKLVPPYRAAHVDIDWYAWRIFVSMTDGTIVQTSIGWSHLTARTVGKARAAMWGRGWKINPWESTPL